MKIKREHYEYMAEEPKKNNDEVFTKTIGATTAPIGLEWWSNGKSRFSGQRIIFLRPATQNENAPE